MINGFEKTKHPGNVVASFAMGTKKLYDFIDYNPAVLLFDAAYVNNPQVISQNP